MSKKVFQNASAGIAKAKKEKPWASCFGRLKFRSKFTGIITKPHIARLYRFETFEVQMDTPHSFTLVLDAGRCLRHRRVRADHLRRREPSEPLPRRTASANAYTPSTRRRRCPCAYTSWARQYQPQAPQPPPARRRLISSVCEQERPISPHSQRPRCGAGEALQRGAQSVARQPGHCGLLVAHELRLAALRQANRRV